MSIEPFTTVKNAHHGHNNYTGNPSARGVRPCVVLTATAS